MHTCFSYQIRRFAVFLTQSGCDSTAGTPPCKIDRRLLKTRQTRAFSSVGVAVRCERGRCEAPTLSPADFSTLGVYPCFSSSRPNTQGGTSAVFASTLPCVFSVGTFSPSREKADTRALCGLTLPSQERKGRKERRKRTPWFLRHLRHLRHRQKKKSPAAAVRCCGGFRRPRLVPPMRTASGSSSA